MSDADSYALTFGRAGAAVYCCLFGALAYACTSTLVCSDSTLPYSPVGDTVSLSLWWFDCCDTTAGAISV